MQTGWPVQIEIDLISIYRFVTGGGNNIYIFMANLKSRRIIWTRIQIFKN